MIGLVSKIPLRACQTDLPNSVTESISVIVTIKSGFGGSITKIFTMRISRYIEKNYIVNQLANDHQVLLLKLVWAFSGYIYLLHVLNFLGKKLV